MGLLLAPQLIRAAPPVGGGDGTAKQVLTGVKTDTWTASATSFVTIPTFSVTITPTSVDSKIVVITNITFCTKGSFQGFYNIMRDATPIGQGAASGSRQVSTGGFCVEASSTVNPNNDNNNNMIVVDEPNTLSAVTYTVQVKMQSSGVGYVNRAATDTNSASVDRGSSTITVIEAEE